MTWTLCYVAYTRELFARQYPLQLCSPFEPRPPTKKLASYSTLAPTTKITHIQRRPSTLPASDKHTHSNPPIIRPVQESPRAAHGPPLC